MLNKENSKEKAQIKHKEDEFPPYLDEERTTVLLSKQLTYRSW